VARRSAANLETPGGGEEPASRTRTARVKQGPAPDDHRRLSNEELAELLRWQIDALWNNFGDSIDRLDVRDTFRPAATKLRITGSRAKALTATA
jgi:hypothetical protein